MFSLEDSSLTQFPTNARRERLCDHVSSASSATDQPMTEAEIREANLATYRLAMLPADMGTLS